MLIDIGLVKTLFNFPKVLHHDNKASLQALIVIVAYRLNPESTSLTASQKVHLRCAAFHALLSSLYETAEPI
jgi:hypothetical protein